MQMTFDEALKEVSELSKKGADTWYGDQLEKRTNVKEHLETGDVEVIINKLRKEYAPTVEMTKKQYGQFVDFRKRTDSVQTHAVTLRDKKTKYPKFLNDLVDGIRGRLFLQAWLHPETIKVMEEKNND